MADPWKHDPARLSGVSIPVALQVGDRAWQLGHIDVPFAVAPAAGDRPRVLVVELNLDQNGLRDQLAQLLRHSADLLQEGTPDAG